MAVYFLRARHVSRSKGARVTRAAAYRAGERIRDERTGEVYDYTRRNDVAAREILLPADLAAQPDMAWAQDRSALWNAAEHAGRRRNSRLAREWLVLLPPELSPGQRAALARRFAAELVERYRCAVDLTIHRPRPGADPRNHHAHLLMTTRELTPHGLGNRIALEMDGRERYRRGLGPSRDEYLGLRARWAVLTNEALREAGLEQRVDHRGYAARGIDRDPTTTIPEKVFYAERRAGPSVAGEAIRARALERAAARRRGPEELSRVLAEQRATQKNQARQVFAERAATPRPLRWGQLTRAERNARRREHYQARRSLEQQDPAREEHRRQARRREYLAFRQKHPEYAREATRRYRAAHREVVNQNQRDYRRARREQQQQQQQQASPLAAGQSVCAGQSVSPEQSLANWKAYRQQHGTGPTPEDSLRRWLELRARAGEPGATAAAAQPDPPHQHERRRRGPAQDDPDDPQRRPQPDRDHDFGL